MNIFGVGTAEIVVIFLIMLVVAGPKRMVRWSYHLGKYVGKFRKMWSEVVDVLQHEMDEAGVDVKIPKDLPTRQNITKVVAGMAKPYTDELEKAAKDLKAPLQESLDSTDKTLKETAADLNASVADTTPKKSQPVSKVNLGTWGAPKKKDTPTTETPKATENGGYGAWSNPQRPGQQAEQEQ